MSLFGKILVIVGIIAGLLVGWFIYNQGVKNGIDDTTDIWVAKVDSLNQWYAAHPPSPETTTIYIQKPPLVVHDTMTVIDTLFIGDSLITAKYPYAIWNVSYNDMNGGLIVITYNGEKRAENRIGSFAIQGDDKFDFSSSPWKPPVKPEQLTVPFIYTNMNLVVDAYPDYAAIGGTTVKTYVGKAEMKLDYGVVILQRVNVSLCAGLGYDKWRNPSWYPLVGVQARIRILGRY